ncbi:hypothetical protein [Wolbachia endosymbiont (group A) of Clivina fossor]|uniref:hypothetical protein n=1 Tax=Wolbachia endosymbiont (group A) of Clivina fossor TaxID=3066133 RepID=UPI0031332A4C
MKKYTNAWLKTDSNNHDCANDGTCGQSIRDFRIDDSNIFFHDGDGKTIAQIPYLPGRFPSKYNNNLYNETFQQKFNKCTIPKKIQDLLPNQFNFEYGKLNCVIHYDDVSQREQDQIKLDIQNAYEAYKAKFCINSDTQVTVNTYILNNDLDYEKYGTLVPGFSKSQSSLNNSLGITNGESILLHKASGMDKVLAHEFAHVFQLKFSTAEVRQLDDANRELMANAIGLEVEEKNHEVIEKNYKALCEQKGVDEYKDFGSRVDFKYKGTTCTIYRQNLSEEEELQIIKNVKNVCGLIDWYKDFGSWFIFEYKGTTCTIYRQNLSGEEEELQIIKNVMNVCGLVDQYTEYNRESQYGQRFQIEYKGTTCTIYRQNLSEEEKLQVIQNLKKNVCGLVDAYKDHGLVDEYTDRRGAWTDHKFVDRDGRLFELEYKGVFYLVQHKNLSEEEKFQIIQDIRSSYESLVSQCDRLGKKYESLVVIEVDKSKDIDIIYCYDLKDGTLKELDKTHTVIAIE